MQLGDSKDDAKLIVSTVAELEHLLQLLNKYVRDGRRISVLYGIPLPPSQVPRLAEIARRLGTPSAVRAVAGACAANMLAVVIPCHRVVRSDGTLSGYRRGVARKKALILREATGTAAAIAR